MDTFIVELLCISSMIGVLACLISESKLLTPVREKLDWDLLYCPVCLGFWLAFPSLLWNWKAYFLVVALSNAVMLLILKVYSELERE